MAFLKDFFRGDTKEYRLTFKDTEGNLRDMSDFDLWFTMKSDISLPDEQAEIQKIFSGATSPEATGGVFVLVLTSEDTNIQPGSYNYDIQLTKNDPEDISKPKKVFTVEVSKVKVKAEVTRNS